MCWNLFASQYSRYSRTSSINMVRSVPARYRTFNYYTDSIAYGYLRQPNSVGRTDAQTLIMTIKTSYEGKPSNAVHGMPHGRHCETGRSLNCVIYRCHIQDVQWPPIIVYGTILITDHDVEGVLIAMTLR